VNRGDLNPLIQKCVTKIAVKAKKIGIGKRKIYLIFRK
jgi:hypothetical protein